MQVRTHLKLDFANASTEMAVELSKTKAYIMRHVGDMSRGVELVVYYLVRLV